VVIPAVGILGMETSELQGDLFSSTQFHQSSPQCARNARRPQTYNFPSEPLMGQLLELYFIHQNIYLPLLHRPTFERGVADGLHLRSVVIFTSKKPGSSYAWDFFIIVDYVSRCAGMTALRLRSCSCARSGRGGARIPAFLAQVLHAAGSGSTRCVEFVHTRGPCVDRARVSCPDVFYPTQVPQVERHLFEPTTLYDLQYYCV
jgi:hypothetical protein